ncbi:hypothetical protein HK407_06g11560 [Ordospora pajunii]|uniref:uncharacterized protein n=1 Tax=Ordospora pajunii TaxID=3039483 RepID=UPI0029526F57|nr:uncharacterized protein HK407_06g11560 [Ordospora pajunii]KAH9411325.1 hypothetical protein HK407_06g11560 [Ordospora pajunii]
MYESKKSILNKEKSKNSFKRMIKNITTLGGNKSQTEIIKKKIIKIAEIDKKLSATIIDGLEKNKKKILDMMKKRYKEFDIVYSYDSNILNSFFKDMENDKNIVNYSYIVNNIKEGGNYKFRYCYSNEIVLLLELDKGRNNLIKTINNNTSSFCLDHVKGGIQNLHDNDSNLYTYDAIHRKPNIVENPVTLSASDKNELLNKEDDGKPFMENGTTISIKKKIVESSNSLTVQQAIEGLGSESRILLDVLGCFVCVTMLLMGIAYAGGVDASKISGVETCVLMVSTIIPIVAAALALNSMREMYREKNAKVSAVVLLPIAGAAFMMIANMYMFYLKMGNMELYDVLMHLGITLLTVMAVNVYDEVAMGVVNVLSVVMIAGCAIRVVCSNRSGEEESSSRLVKRKNAIEIGLVVTPMVVYAVMQVFRRVKSRKEGIKQEARSDQKMKVIRIVISFAGVIGMQIAWMVSSILIMNGVIGGVYESRT